MKLLFVSNLFPDQREPNRGIYNARLVRHLGEHCQVRVVSPRAALPFCQPRPRQPRPEDTVFAPVYPPGWYLPKIGSRVNPWLMAASLRSTVRRIRRDWDFDAALASWVYPDGCAVGRLAGEIGYPFAVIAQGTDVHQYLQNPVRRRLMVSALNRSRLVVARSRQLACLLADAGVRESLVRVIYNGVDTGLFQPGERLEARSRLELSADELVVLYVGNLLPIKNPMMAVEAFKMFRDQIVPKKAKLIMVGDGPLKTCLQESIARWNLSSDVRLAGALSGPQVVSCYQAADVLCVPSHNEGLPNVVLEALACGLLVAATRVGGIPEVIAHESLGRLVDSGDPTQMAAALGVIAGRTRDPAAVARHAQTYSWPKTAKAYFDALQVVVG